MALRPLRLLLVQVLLRHGHAAPGALLGARLLHPPGRLASRQAGRPASWQAGRLASWQARKLAAWQARRPAGPQARRPVGRPAGQRAGRLAGRLAGPQGSLHAPAGQGGRLLKPASAALPGRFVFAAYCAQVTPLCVAQKLTLRPISLLRLCLLRFADPRFPGNSPWA